MEMLIDSGSICNIITDKTWENMKKFKVKLENMVKNPNKTLVAYGSREPLTILRFFEAEIMVGENTRQAEFYVVKNGTRNLLGKQTAKELREQHY